MLQILDKSLSYNMKEPLNSVVVIVNDTDWEKKNHLQPDVYVVWETTYDKGILKGFLNVNKGINYWIDESIIRIG